VNVGMQMRFACLGRWSVGRYCKVSYRRSTLDLEATWTLTRDKGSSFLTLPLLQGDQLIGDDIFPNPTISVTSNSSLGPLSSHIAYIRSCGRLRYHSDLARLAYL
jgi:hypothetical protein